MLVSLLHSHRLALCLSPVCWAFLSPTTLTNHVHLLYQQRVRLDRVIRIRSRKPSSSQFSNKKYSALLIYLQYSEERFQYRDSGTLDVYELPMEFI